MSYHCTNKFFFLFVIFTFASSTYITEQHMADSVHTHLFQAILDLGIFRSAAASSTPALSHRGTVF